MTRLRRGPCYPGRRTRFARSISRSAGRSHNFPSSTPRCMVLELGLGRISSEDLGALLRSPFLGGAAVERSRRALLDVVCRRGEPVVRFSELLRLAQDKDADGQWRAHGAPLLAARLEEWRRLQDGAPTLQLPSAWAEAVARGLMALGWPGDRSLDSDEYQTVDAWRELLAMLSSLDEITGRMDYAAALRSLARMAAERIFQPKSPEVPVQVMGLLEAAGLEFDCLWITGLHDAAWPASPRPNPFIAIELQRRHALPHASAAREFEFASRLSAGLLSCAPEIIVSHPRRSGDDDLRPSPFIAQCRPRIPRRPAFRPAASADLRGAPTAAKSRGRARAAACRRQRRTPRDRRVQGSGRVPVPRVRARASGGAMRSMSRSPGSMRSDAAFSCTLRWTGSGARSDRSESVRLAGRTGGMPRFATPSRRRCGHGAQEAADVHGALRGARAPAARTLVRSTGCRSRSGARRSPCSCRNRGGRPVLAVLR